MYCIYTGPLPSFSRLGTRVVTLYQHQPWARRQNTHTHTLTHTTHILYTHQNQNIRMTYIRFLRPTCAHLVWCLSKCTDRAFITRYLHLSWFIQMFAWIMVRPPCLSQDGEGRDWSLFTAEACRSGCRRSAGLHTFTLRSCELQPVGLWAAPSRKCPGSTARLIPLENISFFPRSSVRSHQLHVFFLVIQRLPLSLRVKRPRHTIHYSGLQ